MICDDLILWAETKETRFGIDVASPENRQVTVVGTVTYVQVGS